MSELVIEFVLRLGKIVLAGLIGVVVYVFHVLVVNETPTPQLALESWIAGALVVLLLETSAF